MLKIVLAILVVIIAAFGISRYNQAQTDKKAAQEAAAVEAKFAQERAAESAAVLDKLQSQTAREQAAEAAAKVAEASAAKAAPAQVAEASAVVPAPPQVATADQVARVTEPDAFEQAKAKVTGQLKDPSSVQFRNLRFLDQANGKVCGEVNAKNSYGGYTGFTPFFYTHADGKVIVDEGGDGLNAAGLICRRV